MQLHEPIEATKQLVRFLCQEEHLNAKRICKTSYKSLSKMCSITFFAYDICHVKGASRIKIHDERKNLRIEPEKTVEEM